MEVFMDKTIKALSFGEILWDIIEDKEHLGGAPFNLSAHLAMCGLDSFIVSRLGEDDRGQRVFKEMERLSVDSSFVGVDTLHPTGTVAVTLDDGGQPSYTINENVAYDFITLDNKQLNVVSGSGFSVFCFGTLAQRTQMNEGTLYSILECLNGVEVFYDVNLRQNYYSTQQVKKSLYHTTILKLNDEEVRILSELFYGKILDDKEFASIVQKEYELNIVLITKGEKGCAVYCDRVFELYQGPKVTVADAVGAGDAFSAAFLYRFCHGDTPFHAAQTANRLGAFVASCQGAIPQYSNEIIDMLRSS
jgi:fructokinase